MPNEGNSGNKLTNLTGTTTASYEYDANGNMIHDGRKNIDIEYNLLNLPYKINESGMLKATYKYIADGKKASTIDENGMGFDYLGSLVYNNDNDVRTLESTAFGGGRINATNNGYDINYFITDHLGSTRVIVDDSGNITEQNDYYPFGKRHENALLMNSISRYKFGGKEVQTVDNIGWLDFHARMFMTEDVPFFPTQDPMQEKRPWQSAYIFCSNSPINRVDPNGLLDDDYYSSRNGRYLGSDGNSTFDQTMRLIDESRFTEINASGQEQYLIENQLQNESQIICINNDVIQSDLQAVADNSTLVEHQMYITLDRQTATISSVPGEPGTNGKSKMSYFEAPVTGVNFVDKPGGLVLIGQAHGHPATNQAGKITEKTMSADDDVTSARSAQVPVYGVDAMDSKPAGTPAGIHRVSPNGKIQNNVGKTSSGFNIGRDAMELWGRRYEK